MTDNLREMDDATRADMKALLETLQEYAAVAIQSCPVFKPFGAFVDLAGTVALAVPQLAGSPTLADFLSSLQKGFREQASRAEIRAAGYCRRDRVVLPAATDATEIVRICLEHRAGFALTVYAPYRIGEAGTVTFDASFVHPDQPGIFKLQGT